MSTTTTDSAVQDNSSKTLGYLATVRLITKLAIPVAELEHHLAAAGLSDRVNIPPTRDPEQAFRDLVNGGKPLTTFYATADPDGPIGAVVVVSTDPDDGDKHRADGQRPLVQQVVFETRDAKDPAHPVLDATVIADLILHPVSPDRPTRFEVSLNETNLAAIPKARYREHLGHCVGALSNSYIFATSYAPSDIAATIANDLLAEAGAVMDFDTPGTSFLSCEQPEVIAQIRKLFERLPSEQVISVTPIVDQPGGATRRWLTKALTEHISQERALSDPSQDVRPVAGG